MTIKEAVDRLHERICCEKPVQHFCKDDCMHGSDKCEIALSVIALEKQIPKIVATKNFCPCCGTYMENIVKYCYECGQRLKWENTK